MTERTDKERMDFIDKNAVQIVMDSGTQIYGKGSFRLVLDDMILIDELSDELSTQENQPKLHHFADLTKIDVPFYELDRNTAQRLMALPDEAIQIFSRQAAEWRAMYGIVRISWNKGTYRQDPDWVDKKDWPPKPTEEQLKELGMRIVGDKPRKPAKDELYATSTLDIPMSSGCFDWISQGVTPNQGVAQGLRWILERVPEPKPKSGWVECAVTLGNSNAWMVECDNIPHLRTPRLSLYKAMGYKGFGGIRYAENPKVWHYDLGSTIGSGDENGPRAVCAKDQECRPATPEAVRFWVERGEK